MSREERIQQCLIALKSISKGKAAGFEESLTILQDEAAKNGFEKEDMKFLIKYIEGTDLRATQLVSLIKCLIPRSRMEDSHVRRLIIHWMAVVHDLPITVSIMIIQWLVGLWEHQLIDRHVINVYYDAYFYMMLKKERLEPHLARLIYLLTKPTDVTRRQVTRLLQLQSRYAKPQKHINALLSLFKSYKPELVPEKIPSRNIESIWKPIPEALRLGFECARDRGNIHDTHRQEHFDWNVAKSSGSKKTAEPLLPSVQYYHIGSSIYKDKDSKSIFDLSNFDDVGKYHFDVEMPCNAISLLANTAGFHFLTFTDFEYQSRFSYTLYNTLRRAFILESDKFSSTQKEQLLDMTIEFSRYMQEGIPVVNHVLYEYFDFNTSDYRSKFLQLLEWNTSIAVNDLQAFVVDWIHTIFLESSVNEKCEIIKTLRKLVTNLFVKHNFGNESKKPSSFLGQVPASDLIEIIPVLTKLVDDLVVSGLTIHSLRPIFLSAALDFYEQLSCLESRCANIMWTIAPPLVIYGGLVSKSCAILSRVCALLLKYRKMYLRIRDLDALALMGPLGNQFETLKTFGNDFGKALWNNSIFREKHNGYIFNHLSNEIIEDSLGSIEDKDAEFNIGNHVATQPYKYMLGSTGLKIESQQDSLSVALHYFPDVNEFIETIKLNDTR